MVRRLFSFKAEGSRRLIQMIQIWEKNAMARLKRLPEQGIELDLTIYRELRFNHGTTSFLEPENQGVIRNGEMKKFLARATVERLNHIVRYDYMVNGRELLSTSRSILEAPTTQEMIRHIQNATADLKRLSEDDAAPTTRMMIEQFRLPSPKTEPELYRVVTIPGEGQRIIVLWGCESDAGPGVLLGDVTNKLTPISQIRALLYKYWPLLVMLLLALFLSFLISSCKDTNDRQPIPPSAPPKTPPHNPTGPGDPIPPPPIPTGPGGIKITPMTEPPAPPNPRDPINDYFVVEIKIVNSVNPVELRAFSPNAPDAPFDVTHWKLNGIIMNDMESKMPAKNPTIICVLPEGVSNIEVVVESKGVPYSYKGQITRTIKTEINNQSP